MIWRFLWMDCGTCSIDRPRSDGSCFRRSRPEPWKAFEARALVRWYALAAEPKSRGRKSRRFPRRLDGRCPLNRSAESMGRSCQNSFDDLAEIVRESEITPVV